MVKVIHYCWFGKNELPEKYKKYIESWLKYCPGFTLKVWNEDNFDVSSIKFVKDAYDNHNYAFVSDYVRTFALAKEGGLYLDIDVELIKPLEPLLNTSFVGFESKDHISTGSMLYSMEPNHWFYKEVLNEYNKLVYDQSNIRKMSSPIIYTEVLVRHGLVLNGLMQKLDDLVIYSPDYFNPYGENLFDKLNITDNTYSIHHFDGSWLTPKERKLMAYRKKYGSLKGKVLFFALHPFYAAKRIIKKW